MLNNNRYTSKDFLQLVTEIPFDGLCIFLLKYFLPFVIDGCRFKHFNLFLHFGNIVLEAEHKNAEIDEDHHPQKTQKCEN